MHVPQAQEHGLSIHALFVRTLGVIVEPCNHISRLSMSRTPNLSTQQTLWQYLMGNLPLLGENILIHSEELAKTP